MNLTFRNYQDSDRHLLIQLFDQFWDELKAMDLYGRMIHEAEYAEVYTHELLRRINTAGGTLIWACLDTIPVGLVAVEIEQQSEQSRVEIGTSRAGRILELYVVSEHKSQGIGEALMHEAEQFLKKSKCDTVKIEVLAPNQGARRFYDRLGYSEWVVDVFKHLS